MGGWLGAWMVTIARMAYIFWMECRFNRFARDKHSKA